MAKPIDKQYLIDNMKTFVSVILDPRYIIQKAVLPAATADNLGAVFQYIGSDSTNYTIGGFYQCQSDGETPTTYSWVEITTKTNFDNVTIKENSSKQIYVPKATSSALGVVQAGDGIDVDSDGVISVVARLEEIDELPTAAAALEGKIYLLTATQTGYDRGGIYMCEESTETAGTYEWKLISMSPLEAGKGITIENDVISADTNLFPGTKAEYEALSADEKKKYDYIASPETAGGELDVYSTSEVKTNKVWIDGKPIYRKCYTGTTPSSKEVITNVVDDASTLQSIDTLVTLDGSVITTNYIFPIIGQNINTWIRNSRSSIGMELHHDDVVSQPFKLYIEYTKAD